MFSRIVIDALRVEKATGKGYAEGNVDTDPIDVIALMDRCTRPENFTFLDK